MAWVVILTGVIMGPLLGPGFVLSYDMVFTPRQDLLPGSLGIGGGLPRAVPQDAVVALLNLAIPGVLLQKVFLLAIPLLIGFGMLRLLRGAGLAAQLVGSTLAIWNPYVAERLTIGHWSLLIAYGVLPWALAAACDVRRGRSGAAPLLVVLVGIASLTPTGSLLVALTAMPVAIAPGARARGRVRMAIALGAFACWLPWLIPSVLHPSALAADPAGAQVFAMRDEGLGIVATALSLGGIWNVEAMPASRQWPWGTVVGLALAVVALLGLRRLSRLLGTVAVTWWGGVSLLGLAAAVASSLAAQPWTALVDLLPGGGLLRDAHKLLAPLALLIAAGVAMSVAGLAERLRDRATAIAAVAAAVLVPIAALPDLGWGVGGRLATAQYPPEWAEVREVLEVDERSGDVLVLPFATFRRFAWNADRTVLDPAPRWLPRTAVVSDSLTVRTPNGLVTVAGEDPRARKIAALLGQNAVLAPNLPTMGIGWVLVEEGQPPGVPSRALEGLRAVVTTPELSLYAVPGTASPPALAPYAVLVVVVDVLVGALLVGCGLVIVVGSRRRSVEVPGGNPTGLVA